MKHDPTSDVCAACREPFTFDEWANRHSDEDGEDIHERCCQQCARPLIDVLVEGDDE